MSGRTYSATSAYQYRFNGKEQDSAINGNGVDYDYGFRIYDSRIGKFLSVDPLIRKYPELTSYQFASNSPLENLDLDGLEKLSYLERNSSHTFVDAVGNLPGNTVVTAWNALAGTWNKVVDYGNAIFNSADPVAGFNEQVSKDWHSIRKSVKSVYNYHSNTPITKQAKDFIDYASSWDNWSKALENDFIIYGGTKFQIASSSTITTERIAGAWVKESTAGWSQAAIEYQEYVTGVKAGEAFEINGVKFDGVNGNTLLEAKNSYNKWVSSKTGEFYNSFKGREGLLKQARRQIDAANGKDIEWHFSSEKALKATKSLFEQNNITSGIKYVYDPIKK